MTVSEYSHLLQVPAGFTGYYSHTRNFGEVFLYHILKYGILYEDREWLKSGNATFETAVLHSYQNLKYQNSKRKSPNKNVHSITHFDETVTKVQSAVVANLFEKLVRYDNPLSHVGHHSIRLIWI